MTGPVEILDGICDVLRSNVQRSTSWFPMAVTLTAANYPAGMVVLAPFENTYDASMDPTHTFALDVLLVVRGEMKTANQVMLDYLWPGSGSCIYDALDTDNTIGGLVTDVHAVSFQVDAYDGPDEDYTARVRLQVMT